MMAYRMLTLGQAALEGRLWYRPSWQRRQARRSMRQLVMLQAQSIRKQREMNDQEAEGDERWGSTCFLLLMGSGPQFREWDCPC